jgi:hypothetical protein
MTTPNEHGNPYVFLNAETTNKLSPNIWMGTTTTTSGAWSVTFTGEGASPFFAEAPIVVATAQLQDTDVYDRAWASLSTTPTTTGAAGYGLRGANLIAGGSTTRTVPDGTVIHVIAIGEAYLEA